MIDLTGEVLFFRSMKMKTAAKEVIRSKLREGNSGNYYSKSSEVKLTWIGTVTGKSNDFQGSL